MEDIRIKFSQVLRNGEKSPKYSIYYKDRYQGDVYTARDIEPFISAIPVK